MAKRTFSRCPRCERTPAEVDQPFYGNGYCRECGAAYHRERRQDPAVRARIQANGRARYAANPEIYRAEVRAWGQALRLAAITAYGHACACCEETAYEFLAIDHTDQVGAQHRKANNLVGGARFYRWLRDQGYPSEGFQCLCHNCNTSLGHYGYCPHRPEVVRPVVRGPKRTIRPMKA